MTVMHIAEHLTRVYPLRIVFDSTIAPKHRLQLWHDRGEIRIHPEAARVDAQGRQITAGQS